MFNLAVFASGNGSNAENIIRYFKSNNRAQVKLVATNKNSAKVITKSGKLGVPTILFTKEELESNSLLDKMQNHKIDFIILAGFLLKIPKEFLKFYKNKVVNIHPSLLPKYGGSGMFGSNVHKAVFKSKDLETGITIHYVNEEYDKGNIIFQAKCEIKNRESVKQIEKKVHKLEMKFYPIIIESLLNELY